MDEENLNADIDSKLNDGDEGNDGNVPQEPQKQAGSAVKLLKQRNEARNELEEMKKTHVPAEEITKMNEKIAKLEEMLVGKQLQDEFKQEKSKFFETQPKAKEFEQDIDRLVTEKDLTVEEAFRLVAAEKDPTLLMDEQTLNKMDSNWSLWWVPRDNTKKNLSEMSPDEVKDMSDDEFLRQSEALWQKARIASWLLR